MFFNRFRSVRAGAYHFQLNARTGSLFFNPTRKISEQLRQLQMLKATVVGVLKIKLSLSNRGKQRSLDPPSRSLESIASVEKEILQYQISCGALEVPGPPSFVFTFFISSLSAERDMSVSSQPKHDKRALWNESPFTILTSKRRKLEAAEIPVKQSSDSKVGACELASAFALASLASLSPERQNRHQENESRDAKHKEHIEEGVRNAVSWEETRSPKTEQYPKSPEQRAPGSPKSQDAPTTPEEHAHANSRRVHFAPTTKRHAAPSTPTSRSRQATASRRLIVPPQAPSPHRHEAFLPRLRPPYSMNGFIQTPQHHLHAYHPQPWFHGRSVYPPQRLLQPTLLHPENQWICDFCNVAAFITYEEACGHEEVCKLSCSMWQDARQGVDPNGSQLHPDLPSTHGPHHPRSQSGSGDGDEAMIADHSTSEEKWYTGSMSLAMEESDRKWLSELNCFVRTYCVEAYSASNDDVPRSSKRGKIASHQVGIRCRFCAHLPLKDKGVAAVSFPTSIGGIYESVKRWQRVHLEVCESAPQEVRTKIDHLANTNVWVPTTRQYWTDSAKALGLVDTHEGIRFGNNPIEVRLCKRKIIAEQTRPEERLDHAHGRRGNPMVKAEDDNIAAITHTNLISDSPDKRHIIFPEDMDMIPPYVYFLMRQVELCRFTEADRFVARSKGPAGYPGFQCCHCNGHAGLGKYFPVSAKSLSTNSTSQNIHAHLLKCRKCPDSVKDQLIQLKIEKGRSPRLEPGWRKVFFDTVWSRLHG